MTTTAFYRFRALSRPVTEHSIQVQPERNGYGITWYRAVCTCGYHSRRYQYIGGFALAVRAHLKAKGGAAK